MPSEEKVNILLVDDHPEELLALEASLASLDQNLILAGSGEAALRFLLEGDAAVVVLDIQMAGMDGFEVAKALKHRKKTRRIPLIFLTGAYKEERFALQGYAVGAVDYLTKPFDPDILRQKVSVFVDLARYEAELSLHVEELAAQKQLIEEIFANTPAGIAYLDPQLVFLSANAIVLDLLGKSAEELVGRPASEAFANRLHLLGALQQVSSERRSHKLSDLLKGRQVNDAPQPCYEILLHPVLDQESALKGVLFFCSDVTDRVERERLQLAQIDTLQRVDALKDAFLSIVSHELRTPLNAIVGFTEFLQDEVLGPLNVDQHDSVRKIKRGANQLVVLVNDLLDLSRISAGQFELNYDQEDFAGLVSEVVSAMAEYASEKRIAVRNRIEEPLMAEFDIRRMAQVLTNLLENALKFTPEDGAVEIRGGIQEDQLLIEVEDSGIGIESENLSRIFERFTQLDMSSTRQAGGTGLGLYFAKLLIDAHGGTISAKSQGLGKGSLFCFTLPIRKPGPPHDAAGG